MRVALCGGVLVEHDGISFSLSTKLDLLRRRRLEGADVEARAFVQLTDATDDADIVCAPNAWELQRDPWFAAADVYVYEFGIHFSLFDSIFLVPPDRPVLGVFHNITPIELVDDPITRTKVLDSMVQVHNLSRCHEVLCDSAFNASTLAALGVPEVTTTVVGLPPARPVLPRRERSDACTELIFVGRFVRSKGLLDLLLAVHRAASEGASDLRVLLAGSPVFSDRGYLAALEATVDDLGLAEIVEFLLSPDDDTLASRFASADALVLPSYHEGYCLPVTEAMASGCHVITYDAASLPETTAGLGLLVPTGDVEALGDAVADYCQRRRAVHAREAMLVPTSSGDIRHDEWLRRVDELAGSRSLQAYETRFLAALDRAAAAMGLPAVGAGVLAHG